MKGKELVFIFFVAFIIILNSFSLKAQNPFIPKYEAVKRSERCFTVTFDKKNQFGSVWWADKIDFSKDTLFNFVIYMGNRDANGADGLAFVIHADPRDTITDASKTVTIGGAGTWDLEAATGDDGGGLGYAMHTSRVGPNTIPGPHGPGDSPENHKIKPSVALEIDTWNNGDVQDGAAGKDGNGVNQAVSPYLGLDHTSVVYNGDIYKEQKLITDGAGNSGRILPLKPSYAFGTAKNPDGTSYHNIEDDHCYTFQVRWKVNNNGTQDLQLWADIYDGSTNTTNLQLIMTHNDDMITKVFGGKSILRFGFTGSTGGSINEQTICLLGENLTPFAVDDYVSIPANQTTVVDVESNDNDPDGDQLHVPVIIEFPKHGSAVIFDSLNVNFLRYTPNLNYVGRDSLRYVTCDVNSTKCYAKCDTATVYIGIGCIPFTVTATALSPNNVCSDTVPSTGSASANASLPGTLWYEGFQDLSNGTTNDNGTSAWSFTTSGSCNSNGTDISVQTNAGGLKFLVKNSGCEVTWEYTSSSISLLFLM
ncbi:MAG: Ig-like domain-containing protein [Cyclobacteriaceae bacterium]|nr:Ig-like domain-containing protein [Cyclobacteriaceae bacterium]